MNRFEEFSNTYQILEKLGEGSGGVVYLAYHRRLQKEVVLKQIKSKGLSMADKRQEVDILKNLNHSFLPQVLDFLMMGDEVYTVMSYIPGKSLARLMREGARFTLGTADPVGDADHQRAQLSPQSASAGDPWGYQTCQYHADTAGEYLPD